jgi:hypothetical protein
MLVITIFAATRVSMPAPLSQRTMASERIASGLVIVWREHRLAGRTPSPASEQLLTGIDGERSKAALR